jgi:cell division transport system permease protein
MIAWYIKRALQDIAANRFVNAVTVVTIALSILIISASLLFFVNAGDILNAWQKGPRIMAYLEPGAGRDAVEPLRQVIEALEGVQKARFIPREEALEELKVQMKHQASLFENLTENPLPDAFEIQLAAADSAWERVETLAAHIEAMKAIEEVEYGQKWIGTFRNILDLVQRVSFAMTAMFLMAAAFIVANTVRLVIYSRLEEVEIMRLVGAAEGFVKAPFYIEAFIQGLAGAVLGLGVLYIVFHALAAQVAQSGFAALFPVRFLPPALLAAIALAGMLACALGCHVSLRQHLRL